MSKNVKSSLAATLVGLLAFAGVSRSQAQTTSTWITETISSGGIVNWSTPGKWTPATPVPGNVSVDFTGLTVNTAAITLTNDIAGTFNIYQMKLANAATTVTYNKSASTTMNWVKSGSSNPELILNSSSSGDSQISFASAIGSGVTLQITGVANATTRQLSVMSGAGGVNVNKTGTGNLYVTAANTYTGDFTLSSGIIGLYVDAGAGSVPNSVTSGPLGRGTVHLNGGTVTAVSAVRTVYNSVQVGGDFSVSQGAGIANNITFAGTVMLSGSGVTRTITGEYNSYVAGTRGTLAFAGTISEEGAGNGITFANTAFTRVVLSGNNTYTGTTAVNGGTLILGSANALAGSTLNTAGSGTVTYFAGTNNIGGISGNGSISNSGNLLSIGGNSQDTAYSGYMSGNGGLTKVGAGVLTLSGANAYTGATNVTSGTLLVNGNQTAATGAVIIAAEATLGGNGTVGGATTIAGILSPGDGGIGTLNITGNTIWQGASSAGISTDWIFQLGASSTADLINITGNFLKDTSLGTKFRFDFGGSAHSGTFVLVNWSGSTGFSASDFSFTNLGGGLTGSFAFNGSQLEFSTVPEASTWVAMVALAISAVAISLYRQHRKKL